MKFLRILGIGLLAVVVVVVAVLGLRYVAAVVDVRSADSASLPQLAGLGETRSLTVLPLYENLASRPDLVSEHGVSYLVRTDDATILLDFGNNEANAPVAPLEQNMQNLGIDLDEVDVFVLSHHHPDHMGGLAWWQKGTFAPGTTQPDLDGRPIYAPEPLTYPGASPILATQPQRIANGVASLGAAPFVLPFPLALLMPGGKEQVLAVNVAGKGVVLITGCGHPGLETLVARAQAVLDAPVVGVVGGLHYEEAGAAALQPHVEFLQALHPELVALSSHDSGPGVRQEFRERFGEIYRDIVVGEPISVGG